MSMVCRGQVIDSLTYRIQFTHNSSVINTSLAKNTSALYRFAHDLDSLRMAPEVVEILDITVIGNASWEGGYASNLYLGRQRARTVANYIESSFGVTPTMKEPYGFESEIIELVSESGSVYTDEVLSILRRGDANDRKIRAIKNINYGHCWKWLNACIFPLQRRTDIVIRYSVREIVTAPPVVYEPPVQTAVVEPAEPAELAEPADTVESKSSFFLSLKNNIIYDAALVANLGLEISLGGHFALDLPFTFSPYDICSSYRMRTLSVQPELRYYFERGGKGHFLGIHGNLAYYNIVTPFNTRTRYQDRDGEHPLYGGGISYGYSLPFGKNSRWGIEFTIGAGYAYLDYDCFYNVDNGAWFAKDSKHYFGIDKGGLTIYFRLADKNRKKK